jgi:hypothetical protein
LTTLGAALKDLLGALDRLEIPFLIGGSVASSSLGVQRATQDIDIVADLSAEQVADLCTELQGFYIDAEDAREATRLGRAFNVIHLGGAYKFDIFPAAANPFVLNEIRRRQHITCTLPGLEEIEFPVASAEDTILAKLVWYHKGGQTSERQWSDILGVVRIQAGLLDRAYLQHWASELGVHDLLQRAIHP